MRKSKTFKIEGYETQFSVKELTVRQIISLMEEDVLADTSIENLRKQFEEKFLPLCTDGLKMDDILEFAPSELKIIWDHFKEVNQAFFDGARISGLTEMLENFKMAILGDFSKLLVSSSKQDTSEL